MATPIRIKRSAVPGKIPPQGALQYGELALNINDAELYAVRNRAGIGSDVVRLGAGTTVTNIIYVTADGKDTNTGKKLGDAKRTIGAAVTVAGEGTVIKVAAGSYIENNPIVLPKQVSIIGDSLREVSVIPQNLADLFYVTNGNYISDLSFTGAANTAAIFSFNPSKPDFINQSPYIRNCTNFIPNSIGIKVDGRNATGPTKSIVTDSFTQYNANGIGVSITNEGYAQIVDMFTICSNISVFSGSGGQCDINGSNTSFGNYGLVSDGISTVKYTGTLTAASSVDQDTFKVDIDEPVFVITGCQYDNVSGIATITTNDNNQYKVGVAVTLGSTPMFNAQDTQGNSYVLPLPNLELDDVFEVRSIIDSNTFTTAVGPSTFVNYSFSSGGAAIKRYNSRPYNGQIVYFDLPYYFVSKVNVGSAGTGYLTPPTVTISNPETEFGITAVCSAEIENGSITRIDIVSGGRGYINQPTITISSPDVGINTATATVELSPTFYTVSDSTPVVAGITTITLNESVPYSFSQGQNVDFHVQSKILATSHGFEYVGTGITIKTAVPNRGGKPIPENEVDERNGGIVVYSSTDQLGKFKIGDGIVIDQASGTIGGIDYTKSLYSTLTPFILALGGD